LIGDLVRESNASGRLYRSVREPSLRRLVLYPENGQLFTAPVFDPEAALPLNADSWKRRGKAKARKRARKKGRKPK
jgi:hypothetical protein